VIRLPQERQSLENCFRHPPLNSPGTSQVNSIWRAVGTFVSSNLSVLKSGKRSAFKIRIFKNLSWLKYFGHYVTTSGVYSEVVAYYFTAFASVPGCIRYNGGSDAITHRRMTVFNYVIFPVVHSMHLSVNKIACTLCKRNLIQVLKHCSLEVILSINIKSLYSNLNFFFNNSNLQIVKRCIG
jgi:hypothetical protein